MRMMEEANLSVQSKSFGFLSIFIRPNSLKSFAYRIDQLLNGFLPEGCKYLTFGVAKKAAQNKISK